jgi:N-acetylglucosamine kinase-like BadF-type ATPase
MSRYFLGVDGGGSKTAALLTDEAGDPLGRGIAPGSNHLRVGIDTATRNIERAVNVALVEAGIAHKQIEYAYCGIAGSDHPEHHDRVVESLRVFFPRGNFIVDTDARIALTGAVGFGAGVVIIAGTGSVAFGRNESGEEARAGGWGPIIGDEGSGYAIARQGLAAVVRAFDGRGEPTIMTELLCSEYELCNPVDLPRFVYATSTKTGDIARYGKLVVDAAQKGDAVALDILDASGHELGECVLAVVRKLKLQQHEFPVAYVGGVFKAGDVLLEPMRRTIAIETAQSRLAPPERSPVEGAALMAIRAWRNPRPERA